MNELIEHLAGSPVFQRLGLTLLHSLWILSALGIAVFVGLAMLSRRSPQTRYAFAAIGMVVMAVAPVVTFACIQPERSSDQSEVRVASLGVEPVPVVSEILPDGTVTPSATTPAEAGGVERAVAESVAIADRPATTDDHANSMSIGDFAPWLTALWILGVTLLSSWHAGGWWLLQRLRRRGVESVSREVADQAKRLAQQLGISTPVEVVRSQMFDSPFIFGWIKPTILIPVRILESLSGVQLQAVLAHELAHVRRHDYLANLIQTTVETVLFFHPAVWLVSRRIRWERESCCDDIAAQLCGDSAQLAEALVAVESSRANIPPKLAAALTGSDTPARVRRLLGIPRSRANRLGVSLAAVALATFSVIAAMGLTVAGEENEAEPSPEWGALTDGVQMRMSISNRDGADLGIHDVRFEIVNRRETPLTLVSDDSGGATGLAAYVRQSAQFDCEPYSVPRWFSQRARMLRDGEQPPVLVTLSPGESVSASWVETGASLGGANGNPRFNRPGQYDVTARLQLHTSDGDKIELSSNSQEYIHGGSRRVPLKGAAKITEIDSMAKTATIDVGTADGLRVGDEFTHWTLAGGWKISITEVAPTKSRIKIENVAHRERAFSRLPTEGFEVPLDIPRLDPVGEKLIRWGGVYPNGLAVALTGLPESVESVEELEFDVVLRNFGSETINVLPPGETDEEGGGWDLSLVSTGSSKWSNLRARKDPAGAKGRPAGGWKLEPDKSMTTKIRFADGWTFRGGDQEKVEVAVEQGPHRLGLHRYNSRGGSAMRISDTIHIGDPDAERPPAPKTPPGADTAVTYLYQRPAFRLKRAWHQLRVTLETDGAKKRAEEDSWGFGFKVNVSLWRFNQKSGDYDIKVSSGSPGAFSNLHFDYHGNPGDDTFLMSPAGHSQSSGHAGFPEENYTEVVLETTPKPSPTTGNTVIEGETTMSATVTVTVNPSKKDKRRGGGVAKTAKVTRKWKVTPQPGRKASFVEVKP